MLSLRRARHRLRPGGRDEQGSLILAMGVLMVLTFLSLALLARTIATIGSVRRTQDFSASLALADSGLSDALFEIDQGRGATFTKTLTVGAGSTTYTATYVDANTWTVRSQGTNSGVLHALEATVSRRGRLSLCDFHQPGPHVQRQRRPEHHELQLRDRCHQHPPRRHRLEPCDHPQWWRRRRRAGLLHDERVVFGVWQRPAEAGPPGAAHTHAAGEHPGLPGGWCLLRHGHRRKWSRLSVRQRRRELQRHGEGVEPPADHLRDQQPQRLHRRCRHQHRHRYRRRKPQGQGLPPLQGGERCLQCGQWRATRGRWWG